MISGNLHVDVMRLTERVDALEKKLEAVQLGALREALDAGAFTSEPASEKRGPGRPPKEKN